MGRIRELLAHGEIATLAIVFALAFAAFNLATGLAREVISVLQQHLGDDDGPGFYSFTVFETTITYIEVLYSAIVLALLAAGLLSTWLLTRDRAQVCQECRSRVPAEASVCRFCTSELVPPQIDA